MAWAAADRGAAVARRSLIALDAVGARAIGDVEYETDPDLPLNEA
jgi:hypothetical protein